MSKGNRSNVIAIGCGLALAFTAGVAVTALDYRGDYQERYPGYSETDESPGPLSGTRGASEQKAPCANAQGREESGLCAQWRAANAAKQAAEWALWQLFLNVFGLIGLGVTLWFNKRALDIALESGADTDKALLIAERNADAAAAHVKVAQNTARQQLRAYVAVREISVMSLAVGRPAHVAIAITNSGRTPALNVTGRHMMIIERGSIANFRSLDALRPQPQGSLGAGLLTSASLESPIAIDTNLLQALTGGQAAMYVLGELFYEDIFGTSHCTRYRQQLVIVQGSAHFQISDAGNE